MPGIRAVQYGQVQISILHTECLAHHFGAKTGPTHAKQKDMGHTVMAYSVNLLCNLLDLAGHLICDSKPPEPVGDLGGLRLP